MNTLLMYRKETIKCVLYKIFLINSEILVVSKFSKISSYQYNMFFNIFSLEKMIVKINYKFLEQTFSL